MHHFKPLVGRVVDVGGCVGIINKVNDRYAYVAGTYVHVDGDDNPNRKPREEHWLFAYKLTDIPSELPARINYYPEERQEHVIWDFKEIEPLSAPEAVIVTFSENIVPEEYKDIPAFKGVVTIINGW
jgi:hypothetical protein